MVRRLRKAELEAENIKGAVRQGKATVTLLEMLEETEAKIQRLRAEDEHVTEGQAAIHALPGWSSGTSRSCGPS